MPRAPQVFGQQQANQRKERDRGTKQQRGYGGEWYRISLLKRQMCPVCERCRNAATDDVDHIIPFKSLDDPLRTAWDNLMSLCRSCHNGKTHGRKNRLLNSQNDAKTADFPDLGIPNTENSQQ